MLFFGLLSCGVDKNEVHIEEENYVINGYLTGFPNNTKFYLYNLSTETNVDSALVQKNKFTMSGQIVDPPGLFWLRTFIDEKMIFTTLLIKNEDVEIRAGIEDFPHRVQTSGSKSDSSYREAMKNTLDFDLKRDSIIHFYTNLSDEEKVKKEQELFKDLDKIQNLITKETISYIKQTNNTYASIMKLGFYKDLLPKDTVQELFKRYTEEMKESRFGKNLRIYLESAHNEIGDQFFDFSGIRQDNEKVTLSELRRKNTYLLLNYTSANCGHAINATKELKEIHKRHISSLDIVSFSSDLDKKDWLKSVEIEGNLWPSLWNGEGVNSEDAISYNFSVTPTFLLIDPQGIIIDRWLGYEKGVLMDALKKYLQ